MNLKIRTRVILLEVVEVSEGGVGDRVCVDLTSLLDPKKG